MRPRLNSKSAVYAGENAMDLSSWESSTCPSIETKEVGEDEAPSCTTGRELQPEDRISQISFQLIRSLHNCILSYLKMSSERAEGGAIQCLPHPGNPSQDGSDRSFSDSFILICLLFCNCFKFCA